MVRLSDPDPWWHLATGRWIVEHHAIPHVDPFSFTMAGAPWRAVDWLADLLLWGSFALAGNAGVGALTALSAFAMLVALGFLLRELELSTAAAVAIVACVGVMVQGRYSMARPMMLGAVALCATMLLCARTWRRRDASVFGVVPLVAAWSVVHSTVILGIAVVGLFAVAGLVARHASWRRFAAAAALSLAVAALLPSARGRFAVAFGLEHASLAVALTREWARTRLGDRELWLPLAGALAAAVTLVRAGLRDRARLRDALPYLGCLALGALVASRFARNLYEAILLAAPACGLALERAHAWLAARKLRSPSLPSPSLVVVLAAGVLVPVLHLRLAPDAFDTRFGVGPADGAVPAETLAVLRSLPAARVMNDCTLGGWLIFQRVPVYCDGRTVALYREADVERLFVPLYANAATIDAVADEYDIHYALARFDSDFHDTLMRAPSWVPLAYDREDALFVRRKFAAELPRDVVALDQLRFANDARWLDGWYARIAADPARSDALERQAIRAVALCPTSRTLHAALAYLGRAQPALADRLKRALEASLR